MVSEICSRASLVSSTVCFPSRELIFRFDICRVIVGKMGYNFFLLSIFEKAIDRFNIYSFFFNHFSCPIAQSLALLTALFHPAYLHSASLRFIVGLLHRLGVDTGVLPVAGLTWRRHLEAFKLLRPPFPQPAPFRGCATDGTRSWRRPWRRSTGGHRPGAIASTDGDVLHRYAA